MIRVLLSAPLCLHIRLSSRFTCWPEMWIVPLTDQIHAPLTRLHQLHRVVLGQRVVKDDALQPW
jgi:hypothetical protein